MSKRRSIFLSALFVCLAVRASHAGAGSDGAAFLKIDAGARAGGMAGAFTAVAEDALSIFYNPAGPALSGRDQAALAHAEWFQGLRNEHGAYVHPVSDRLAVFTGFAALLSSRLDEYDASGFRTGSFSAMDSAAGVGAAWKRGEDLSFGFFAKAVCQQAAGEKAYAYAGDIGALYTYGERYRFGGAVQNLGTGIRLHRTSFPLPRTYRAGGAYRVDNKAWLTSEISKAGGSSAALALGAEGEYAITGRETVFARLGYKTGRSKNAGPGVSAGLGVRTGYLGIDYAFSPFGDLGDSHRFTLVMEFGGAPAAEARKTAGGRKAAVGKAVVKKKTKRARKADVKPERRPKTENSGGPIYFMW